MEGHLMNLTTVKEAADIWDKSQNPVGVCCLDSDFVSTKIKKRTRASAQSFQQLPNQITTSHNFGAQLTNAPLKPFLKWAGGKGQILPEIRKCYPADLGRNIYKYAEPFVGGGAVLFDILNRYTMEEVYISDSNAELINVYSSLRDDTDTLIDFLKGYEASYLPLENEARKSYYYKQRTRFNELKCHYDTNTELAALFIFLNRTCFNGLYRVNAKGGYNVPMGSYKSPTICDEANLRRVAKALCGITIVCADYKTSREFIDKHTLVYFDPPYRPLSSSASFTSYTTGGFDDTCQLALGNYIKELAHSGVCVIASNSDPKNSNPEDNFFDELYSGMQINRIYASRAINSKASARGKITELLICSNASNGKD
jgi:hypothetical protein